MGRIRGTLDFADTLHARAREAASEQRKLLISLSTGGVGVFFFSLTSTISPPISELQKYFISASLVFLASAILSGLYAWHADALRNYYWAQVEAGEQKKDGTEYDYLAGLWKRRLQWSTTILISSFILGQLFAIAYIWARIFSL